MNLIEYMEQFSVVTGLKFIKKPNRLEMRFEKPFTLSVLRNNLHLIQAFPENSIKTCIVNMSQTKDYARYKVEKNTNPDVLTTPFHVACKLSNDEAVRQLVDQ